MKIGKFVSIAVIVCLLPLKAMAAAPKLSGNYALTYNEFCQVTLGWSTDLGLTTIDDGKMSLSSATATFSPAAGTVTLSASGAQGSVLIVPGLSDPSETMAGQSFGGTVGYSTTASTLTMNGITFDAAFGMIVKGVAKYVSFTAVDPQKAGCAIQGTAVHQ